MLIVSFLLLVIMPNLYNSINIKNYPRQALTRSLFAEYSKDVRPPPAISATSEILIVDVNPYLLQIIHLDEKQRVFSVRIIYIMRWEDLRFQWSLKDYNVPSITVPQENVWYPDIVAFNDLHDYGKYQDRTSKDNVRIFSNGTVEWLDIRTINVICDINVQNFPFDKQICSILFLSSFHNNNEIRLVKSNYLNYSHFYIEHNEWQLIDNELLVQNEMGSFPGTEFSKIIMKITIQRRPLYYEFHLILPSFLIIIVSTLSFLMPAENGERISMCVTTLLSVVVFLLMVADKLPPDSTKISRMAKFFAAAVGFLCLICSMNVVVINIHQMAEYNSRFPKFLSCFMNSKFLKWLWWMPGRIEQENENETLPDRKYWLNLSRLIDRLGFVLSIVGSVLLYTVVVN